MSDLQHRPAIHPGEPPTAPEQPPCEICSGVIRFRLSPRHVGRKLCHRCLQALHRAGKLIDEEISEITEILLPRTLEAHEQGLVRIHQVGKEPKWLWGRWAYLLTLQGRHEEAEAVRSAAALILPRLELEGQRRASGTG